MLSSLRTSLFRFIPTLSANSNLIRPIASTSTFRSFATESSNNSGSRDSGTVKWFDASKGFGFITKANGEDVFVHFSAIKGSGYRSLQEGQKVEFRIGTGERSNKPTALDVEIKQ